MPVAVNDPDAQSLIMYDGHFGTITPRRNAVEMAFVPRQSGGLRLNHELRFRLVGAHGPGRFVPPGQVVLSGSGLYGLGIGCTPSGIPQRDHRADDHRTNADRSTRP